MLLALAEPFPPPVSLSSGYCTVVGASPNEEASFLFVEYSQLHLWKNRQDIQIIFPLFFFFFLPVGKSSCAGHRAGRTAHISSVDPNKRVE